MQAILIPVTGTIVPVTVETRDDIHKALDADLFEIVRLPSISHTGAVLLVDESGAISGRKQPNPRASKFYPGTIYGDVLILGEARVEDEDGWPDYDLVGLDRIEQPFTMSWLEVIQEICGS